MNPPSSNHTNSPAADGVVIGFSVSHQPEGSLVPGPGLESLREVLFQLVRPLLRQGANLAYAGGWKETGDNFTYTLLRWIRAERESGSPELRGDGGRIGRLYNHTPWPFYLDIRPGLEAQWDDCCRIVRVTQRDAGFKDAELAPDADAARRTDRVQFNWAVTLSAMRRRMLEPMNLENTAAAPERIPAVMARVALGGRVQGFAGGMPGIFEEALAIFEASRPLYLVGGFGGAAGVLARSIANPAGDRPPELTVAWHEQHTPDFKHLLALTGRFRMPDGVPGIPAAFDRLWRFVEMARQSPSTVLNTGLTDDETRELLTTPELSTIVRLVRDGLVNQCKLPPLTP